jgi:hypothetical protein
VADRLSYKQGVGGSIPSSLTVTVVSAAAHRDVTPVGRVRVSTVTPRTAGDLDQQGFIRLARGFDSRSRDSRACRDWKRRLPCKETVVGSTPTGSTLRVPTTCRTDPTPPPGPVCHSEFPWQRLTLSGSLGALPSSRRQNKRRKREPSTGPTSRDGATSKKWLDDSSGWLTIGVGFASAIAANLMSDLIQLSAPVIVAVCVVALIALQRTEQLKATTPSLTSGGQRGRLDGIVILRLGLASLLLGAAVGAIAVAPLFSEHTYFVANGYLHNYELGAFGLLEVLTLIGYFRGRDAQLSIIFLLGCVTGMTLAVVYLKPVNDFTPTFIGWSVTGAVVTFLVPQAGALLGSVGSFLSGSKLDSSQREGAASKGGRKARRAVSMDERPSGPDDTLT